MGRMTDALERMRAAGSNTASREDEESARARLRPAGAPSSRAIVEPEDGPWTFDPEDSPWTFTGRPGSDVGAGSASPTIRPLPSVHARVNGHDASLAGLIERTFLAPAPQGETIRSVIFAPVDAGDRSSALAAAAAEVLAAHVSGRICVVDARFDRPSLHDRYGVENAGGFADALSGTGSIRGSTRQVLSSRNSAVWLVTAGKPPNGHRLLLGGEWSRRCVQELSRSFDFVLYEAPAVNADSAAAVLGKLTDGVILVVDANVTRRESARLAADALRASDVHVLGAVLNNRTFPIPDVIYRRL
jgi:Mrp family chromosome partitioning ATPase